MELSRAWEPPVSSSVARSCATMKAQNCLLNGDKNEEISDGKREILIGFVECLIIPSVGRNGGLAMLWGRDVKVEIQSYSRCFIDAFVTDPDSGFQWRITGFYGNPKTHQRKESWDLLKYLSQNYQMPWLCFGGFNEIVSVEEKLGRVQRSQNQMDVFREVIHQCRFMDLGYCGPEFTWCNMQEGESKMYLRLDRTLASNGTSLVFMGTQKLIGEKSHGIC